MPPLQLTDLLHTSLPHVSVQGRALLSALGCVNGRPTSATEFAHWLGFHDRYQLARALKREGLPPIETLGGWTRMLYWMIESQVTGATLRELALREHLDPAVAYKLVRRVTGRRWSEIREVGLTGAVLNLRDHCRTSAPPARSSRLANPPLRVAWLPGQERPELRTDRRSPPARLRGLLAHRLPISGAPFDVAIASPDIALVTRHHAAAVDMLALAPQPPRVIGTIQVGPVPSRVVLSRDGNWAYVPSQFGEAIDIIDLERGARIAEVPVTGHPLGAVLSTDGRILYVATNRDRLVAVLLAGREIVADLGIPHGSLQMCRHPSGNRLYASGWRTGLIAEIQVPALRLLRTFAIGGIVQELAVTPDGSTLYAANEAGWLDVIHLATGARRARVEFGTAAMGLAVSADQADVIVGLLFAGGVVVIDRQTLKTRSILPTGGRPRLMTAHPMGAVLVANEAGWVDVIK
jgi:DNA-binding beta-propeller fold protein YncE